MGARFNRRNGAGYRKSNISLDDNCSLIACTIIIFLWPIHEKTSCLATRQYFDYLLFEFEIPAFFHDYTKEELKEQAITVERRNRKKAIREYGNSGEDEYGGVRDWYVGVEPNLSRSDAILHCQRQNYSWDKKLTELHCKALSLICAILVVVFTVTFYYKTDFSFVAFLLVVTPIVLKVFDEHKLLKEYKSLSTSIKTILEPSVLNDENELLRLQYKIDSRRALPLITPGLLYKINRPGYHEELKRKDVFRNTNGGLD